jgi:hypothetical protein
VSLFRPNQYRLQKLPLMIKESVTLMIGYGLGDFNVLTAVDWSFNVFARQESSNPTGMIQLVHSNTPNDIPYLANGIIVLEFKKLKEIFAEVCRAVARLKAESDQRLKKLAKINNRFLNPSEKTISMFVDSASNRAKVLISIKDDINYVGGFQELLSKCFELTWSRAEPKNAFYAYAQTLNILLDVLEAFDVKNIPPALMEMLSFNLNRVANYLGNRVGDAIKATKIWNDRKGTLAVELVKELRNICRSKGYFDLAILLDEISVNGPIR